MKYYLKLLSVPILFFVLYTSLFIVWRLFDLPPTDELTRIVGGWFDTYGIPILFLSSILEGILLVGGYFPGVFVIFVGVIIADSPTEAILAVFTITFGLMVAHITNYLLGKYGWYKILVKFGMKDAIERSKLRLEKKGPIAIPLSYWLPSIGALTDTAAGIIHLPFRTFFTYSLISSVFWYSLVGFIVYVIGDPALSVAAGGTRGIYIIYSIIIIWSVILIALDFQEKKSKKSHLLSS